MVEINPICCAPTGKTLSSASGVARATSSRPPPDLLRLFRIRGRRGDSCPPAAAAKHLQLFFAIDGCSTSTVDGAGRDRPTTTAQASRLRGAALPR